MLASICPGITVLRGQHTNWCALFRLLVDLSELRLKLGCVQLFAIDLMVDLEELVLADDHDIRMLLVTVLGWVIGWFGGNSGAVEHVLVAGHGNRELLHVFRLEASVVHLLLELQDS